ncbi:MAG: zinc-dependent metalloprotease [Acidimicrobiia bacterium]|nr:zinc-dependent metalloprotease [Acidimicrobiia bacterium]MDH4366346.1 zinc-dependent metalloprotease [Acidimicrobiia bacterium]
MTSGDNPGGNDVPGDGWPGGGMPFFDLSGLLGGARAGDPWAGAADLAAAIASEGGAEPNLDPLVRIRIEELVRVAELHVAQATGIALPSNTTVVPVTRGEWTRRSLVAYRPFFERFGEALGSATPAAPAGDPLGMMLGQLFQSLGPALVSASAGSLIGHLGQRALGQYDLPVPRSSSEVLVVPATIDQTAAQWGVPVDDLRLWVLVEELATHAVLSRPHVGRRLESLLIDFAAAFRPNPEAIAERFASFESLTDLSQLQEMSEQLSDPDAVLTLMRSPAHDLLAPQFEALVAAVLGFVSHTVDEICRRLVGSHDEIRARFRQRAVDVAPADRFMERLLGVEITERTLGRGDRFIDGIVTRAGDEGLERLWADELDLPTAAEIDAPGLWLARIGFDADPGAIDIEIPDDLSGLDDGD